MVQSLDDARRRNHGNQGGHGGFAGRGGAPGSGGSGGPTAGSAGRVPPHNLQAEESLLGAMLLSRDAIASAVEMCSADDFYKPAHGHVFDAVCSLYAQGEPADPVTVADELRRADLLDAIGGPATLITLQANTPATTNAGRYARIVEEHALLRRLIGVAGEIAEMSYGVPEDVAEAVDRAETLVFEVAERRVTDSLRPLHDLLSESLDRLEALYDRGESITGVPTGYLDLDERLSGLQPSSLVILGARPSMGKALSLDTPIPTPKGWTTMGDLGVGDTVIDERGAPCSVVYATAVMLGRTCFRVTFDDGSSIVADADHQWLASRAGSGRPREPRVVTTQQMVDQGVHSGGRPQWDIAVASPLDLPQQVLPIDPYQLGALLRQLESVAPTRVPVGASPPESAWAVSSSEGPANDALVIPRRYLRASHQQRQALLRGLLAGERSAAKVHGGAELAVADPLLAAQARELVCSLGHRPGPITSRPAWRRGQRYFAWTFRWMPQPHHCGGRGIVSIAPCPSVPVRCITVDSPNHLYLAGESMIPTHNTAMALGMAAHAAMEAQTPVLFFSLEMSHSEVTQRLLCAEARVDSTRVRNGKLLESDWPKISHAIGRLGESPLYIDDNPNLTVMEIRAKARRLRSRLGNLGLIVVDYLQLMSGRHSAENRQVEVSEISRGLKILARELEVPVVALSQLSRNLEMRADKRPVLADLRESGCLPASTRLLRADNGQEITLGELVLTQQQPLVWSVDRHHRIVAAKLTDAFPSGIKAVFSLRLASGRSVDATANHQFLTVDGWARLDSLQPGSFVAVPRQVPTPVRPDHDWSDDELTLAAHLIGGGTIGPSFKYATADPANKAAVEIAAQRLFGIQVTGEKVKNTWQVWFPSPYKLTHGINHPMRNWLEPHGLWKSRAWTKFVPPTIFSLCDDKVALFLHHLWATNGSLTIGRNRHGLVVRTYYSTTSHRLAFDVQHLLLRFGIRSAIERSKKRRVGAPTNGAQFYRDAYSVRIQGAVNQARFLREIGCHGQRGKCIPTALDILDGIKADPIADLVPSEVADQIRIAASMAGVSGRDLAAGLGERYHGYYLLGSATRPRRFSRARLAKIAALVESRELADLATSHLYWDKVLDITSIGEQPTFDATVENTHNFIANGIVAHNSLEQDADVVMFLYRDEVYNSESPDRGTAEVIISKHRNGPTGVTHLAFLDHYTRFANMARV
jgi:replicative DNA helicase